MKKFFIGTFVLSIVLSNSSSAQFCLPAGARCTSMGYAAVTAGDTWSVNNNPAGMASIKQFEAGLFFSNHYYLKELSSQSAGLTFPTRYGALGASVYNAGDPAFHSLQTGIAYARLLGFHLAAGVRLDIINLKLGNGYGSRTCGTFDAGIQLKLTDKMKLGAQTFNPVRVHLSSYEDERIPTIFRTGLEYSYSGKLIAIVEVSKSTSAPLELLTGLEYKILEKGFVRIGVTSSPFRYSFGAGFVFSKFSFDISSTYHEILGFSPQASIQYRGIN